MNNSATLSGKRAIVFGAGGSIGAAVAKEFASEGAEVFLSGRTCWPPCCSPIRMAGRR